ncbi:hypothetical protein [Streptomyces vilmorinianum]|uniref:hypothetical protein n=1 Tax=Streptomyces vilmorinianum TaxID=3051092 RepID=UPI0020C7883B|nr:hypothetical protein [Streptomyces vilmorinianum]
MMINPFNAIEIDPSLAVPHEPVVSEDEWVQVGVRLIEEHGAELALRALLRTLKGDYVGAEQGSPFGYHYPDQAAVDAHTAFLHGCDRILRRLAVEPNLLQRSISAMHADETMDREDRIEMLRAESDASLMREIMTATPETWHELSEEATIRSSAISSRRSARWGDSGFHRTSGSTSPGASPSRPRRSFARGRPGRATAYQRSAHSPHEPTRAATPTMG